MYTVDELRQKWRWGIKEEEILADAGAKVVKTGTEMVRIGRRGKKVFITYEIPGGSTVIKTEHTYFREREGLETCISFGDGFAGNSYFTGKIIDGYPVFGIPNRMGEDEKDVYWSIRDGERVYYKIK